MNDHILGQANSLIDNITLLNATGKQEAHAQITKFNYFWASIPIIIFLSILVSSFVGMATNLILPSFNNFSLFWVGPFFSGYMVLGTTWQLSVFGTEVVYAAFLLFSLEKFISEKTWYFIPIPIAMITMHLPFYLYLYSLLIIIYYTLRFAENQQWHFGKWFVGLASIAIISGLGVGIGAFMFGSNLFQMIESPRGSGEFAYTTKLISQPVLAVADSVQRSTNFMRLFSTNMIGNAETFRGWNNYMEAPMYYCGLLSLVAAPQVFYFGIRKTRILYGVLLGLCFWVMFFPYFRYTFWLFTGDYYRTLGLFTLLALLYLNLKAIQQILEEKRIGLLALLATVMILFVMLFGFAPDGNLNKSLQKSAAADPEESLPCPESLP
jgi:hypothetical protein